MLNMTQIGMSYKKSSKETRVRLDFVFLPRGGQQSGQARQFWASQHTYTIYGIMVLFLVSKCSKIL